VVSDVGEVTGKIKDNPLLGLSSSKKEDAPVAAPPARNRQPKP